ncbi:MAG: aminoacyl-tRNA hydrolase [Gammaproteobacteria bacterium]|nr:aminoacyl-tRNA hydrolase [Gammaproteobacteria bacterium]
MSAIRFIVGLGNPGPRYKQTRHNVGAWFVSYLADRFKLSFIEKLKFKGRIARGNILGHDTWLALPSTFMNLSGECVGSLASFYRIPPEQILVVHDEMAFSVGQVRLKFGGGVNGHNGLKSVVKSLENKNNFYRLRVGVGHPGEKDLVTDYLTLDNMTSDERDSVEKTLSFPDDLVDHLLSGNVERVMNTLHGLGDDDGI